MAIFDYQDEMMAKAKYADLFVDEDCRAFMRSIRTAISNFAAAGVLAA
jgi:hypothetical protein